MTKIHLLLLLLLILLLLPLQPDPTPLPLIHGGAETGWNWFLNLHTVAHSLRYLYRLRRLFFLKDRSDEAAHRLHRLDIEDVK
jgi:hypothetical protein